jgi:hypothetical protein
MDLTMTFEHMAELIIYSKNGYLAVMKSPNGYFSKSSFPFQRVFLTISVRNGIEILSGLQYLFRRNRQLLPVIKIMDETKVIPYTWSMLNSIGNRHGKAFRSSRNINK